MTIREVPDPSLVELDCDLWVARRPLALWIGDIGCCMTVIRLRDGRLLLHSPVPFDKSLGAEVAALGEVRWILGPNMVHHFYLNEWARAFPAAELWAAPGLAKKRREISFAGEVNGDAPWGDDLRHHVFCGAPLMNEVVLFHSGSRTLVLTDLAFNVTADGRNEARLFHRIVGATGRFGPHRMIRTFIRDRAAARESADTILAWDFDRVVVSHGEVLETGGHAAMRAAFSFLPEGRRQAGAGSSRQGSR
jgi:hypothetical protein